MQHTQSATLCDRTRTNTKCCEHAALTKNPLTQKRDTLRRNEVFTQAVCAFRRVRALLVFLIKGLSSGSPAVIDSQWPKQRSPSERKRADFFRRSSLSWNIHANRLTGWILLIIFTVPTDAGAVANRKGQFVCLHTQTCRQCDCVCVWEWQCLDLLLLCLDLLLLCLFCFVFYCFVKWMLCEFSILSCWHNFL